MATESILDQIRKNQEKNNAGTAEDDEGRSEQTRPPEPEVKKESEVKKEKEPEGPSEDESKENDAAQKPKRGRPPGSKKKAGKKKASKKKASRKVSGSAGGSVLDGLNDELSTIREEDNAKREEERAKADLRATKVLVTRLKRFKNAVDSALEAAQKRAADLDEKLSGESESDE